MEKTRKHALNIVIADDDPDDQYLMQKAIWELNSNHKITSVYNGMQLLEYLLRKGTYKNCIEPKPDCIFLDLNMPLLTGIDALPRIRKNPDFAQTPVYIFTTSNCPNEKQKLIAMGANGFYTKSPKHFNLKLIVQEVLYNIKPHPPENIHIQNKNI
ncbi:MAG: response regulator [Bacteroidia bacterium]